jgi:hypothetical protein
MAMVPRVHAPSYVRAIMMFDFLVPHHLSISPMKSFEWRFQLLTHTGYSIDFYPLGTYIVPL